MRAAAVMALVAGSAFGLSACRTIESTSESGKTSDDQAKVVAAAPSTPVPTPVPTADPLATTPADAVPTTADVGSVATTPDGDAEGTTPAGGADSTSPDPAATTPAATVIPPQPPKIVVDNPWVVVGRPFIVDTTAPRGTTTGLTGFQLIFRTRGDFRGVRAGTPLEDPRHYKIGALSVPELPAYLPSGPANLQLGDRNKSKGRYCWIATLGKQGTPGKIVFPARANGIAMAIEFDLYRAPVQHRTAPVFVRTKSGEQPSALQNKLGCHLNYF